MKQKELSTFLEKGLHEMFQAEHQILEGLRLMQSKAATPSLKKAFQRHEKETRNQIDRIIDACDCLGISYEEPKGSAVQKALGKGKEILKDIAHLGSAHKMSSMHALLEEGKEMAERYKDLGSEVLDMALCGGAQQIELAEISAYHLLCHFARKLDEQEAFKLLEENLEEEKDMLSILTIIHENELLDAHPKVAIHKKPQYAASR
ncbi:MAG: DUF892 family protein [Verrucomicrobia bacterium]|nr:DUF892 family protein [Verrucomicrobiota bacterium]